jgi:hypothetical protein
MSDRADELTADMRATRMRKSPNPQHMASLGKKGKSLEKILVRKIGRTERIVKGIQRASQIISP